MVKTNARVDPDLKEETGFNTELEWRGTFRNCLYVDLSLFYLRCKDRIGSVFTTDSRFITYRLRANVSDSRNLGLEVLLDDNIMNSLIQGNRSTSSNKYFIYFCNIVANNRTFVIPTVKRL